MGFSCPLRSGAVAVLLLLATASALQAEESAADVAARGLAECEEGRNASERDARQAHFRDGQTLGEQAVALDDTSADAHFAIVCNMGELMRLDGETISSVLELRHLFAELDRTLALNPDHVKALATKGILLCRLPRILGGDAVRGEEMLHRVVAEDATAINSRLILAQRCASRGEKVKAREYAVRALQIARDQGRADAVAEAQATLAQLGPAQ
jgi:hypothetical protein